MQFRLVMLRNFSQINARIITHAINLVRNLNGKMQHLLGLKSGQSYLTPTDRFR